MSLLDLPEPAPIDGAKVRRVAPLGPDESLQLERERKAKAERERRARKGEQINQARRERRALLRKGYA